MYWKMRSLWDSCVMREEENDCDDWPECENCPLVEFNLIKLPKCWNAMEMDFDSEDDKLQLSLLVLSHITGKCGNHCLFCELEKIPI